MPKRSRYIGGHDSSSIINKNNWRSRLDVWQQKVHDEDQSIDNFHIRRGNETEPKIDAYVKNHLDSSVNSDENFDHSLLTKEEDDQIFLMHPEYDFIGGSPDGISDTTVWEYKAPTMYKTDLITNTWHQDITYESILKKGLPFSWVVQVQHYQMLMKAITGNDYDGQIAVWNYDLQKPFVVPVKPDNRFQERLLEEYLDFWHYVEMGIVPPAMTDEERFHIEIMDEPMLDAIIEGYKIGTDMRYRGKDYQSEERAKLVTYVKNSGQDRIITEHFHASVKEIHREKYSYWKVHAKQREDFG